ncbi:MAG TPA: hypothetical protein VLC91_06415 [Spongiibacteraceae bacterium]|nr:hypothetical protein [Spongiibacteraceae bacterium]
MNSRITDAENIVTEVQGTLSFTKPTDVSPDTKHPGMLRAAVPPYEDDPTHFASHACRIRDCAALNATPLDLATIGFDTIELAHLADLQTVLERVRRASFIADDDAADIRSALLGQSFRLSNGKRLRLLFIAPEGLILRKAGPNGLKINADEKMTEMNGHGASQAVHSDQDVRGTPIRQIMRGVGPWLFRHEAPDGANRHSPVFLVNLWIPLQQITRPLTLMDQRTVDRRRHQLRYALPTDDFLQRDAATKLNDIWTFLHDDAQQWYFTSAMDSKRAYIFNTLGTPHGAFILPGEAAAEQRYLSLQAALDALAVGDANALKSCTTPHIDPLPTDTTAPLRQAIATMDALIAEAQADPERLCSTPNEWKAHATIAMDKLVRKSIELRAVAIVVPDVWPLNRL